jgi:hypothetical protein
MGRRPLLPWAVYYSTYATQHRRRVHIVAPVEFGPRSQYRPGERQEGYAFCRVGAYGAKTVIEPPYELPAGLVWCPGCLGGAAEAAGVLGLVAAAVLTAIDDAKAAADCAYERLEKHRARCHAPGEDLE